MGMFEWEEGAGKLSLGSGGDLKSEILVVGQKKKKPFLSFWCMGLSGVSQPLEKHLSHQPGSVQHECREMIIGEGLETFWHCFSAAK